jgi:CubicO group peptidase (beta-lactamase class C family)
MKRFAVLLMLLLAASSLTFSQSQDVEAVISKTEAGKVLAKFMQAYNSGNVNIIRRFFLEHDPNQGPGERNSSVEQRVSFLAMVYKDLGKLNLRKIELSTEYEITVLCQAEITEGWSRIPLKIGKEASHPLLTVGFLNAKRPAENLPRGPKLSAAEIVKRFDSYMNKVSAADKFAGVVLVARKGKVIFKKAYGMASNSNAPNRIDTKFDLASMNKMFTSVAVAQLAQQGNLSFNDSISKFFPDFPNKHAAEKITIHHLLTHTSGLADYFDKKEYHSAKRAAGGRLKSPQDYFPFFAGDPLNFEPGEKWEYSNAGFNVLGAIIEKASGQSYSDYVTKHILRPLGMNNTDPNNGSSAGGALSTVDDLLKFDAALRKYKLLNKKYTDIITTAKVNSTLETRRYAYGFVTKTINGKRIVGHGGETVGISTDFNAYLDHGYTVIVLSNYDPPSAANISGKLEELIVQE